MSGYSESGARNRLHILYVDGAGNVHSYALDCDTAHFRVIVESLACVTTGPVVCQDRNGRGIL